MAALFAKNETKIRTMQWQLFFRLGKDHFLSLPGVPNKITSFIEKILILFLIDKNEISNEYLYKVQLKILEL